jgi:hypothetical protein
MNINIKGININLDRKKNVVNVNIKDLKYSEEDFDEFFILLESTWLLIKNENLMCHLLINLEEYSGNHSFPLQVYIKLATYLSSLTPIFNSHCHGICILAKEVEIWSGIYNIIKKLWHPPMERPLLLSDNPSEIKLFIKTNKIINL